jgi:type IV pilus assembly protein PilW
MVMQGNKQKGFTLVELLVVIAVSGILSAVIFTTYTINQGALEAQTQVSDVQQNVRSAMLLITRDMRMAGYDPLDSWKKGMTWGFTEIGYRKIDGVTKSADPPVAASYSYVTLSGDMDGDGGAALTAGDQITYSIVDLDNDGSVDLVRTINAGTPQLLADNIFAMGIAYAYDNDGDNNLDTYVDDDGVKQIIWAIDTDSNGWLDHNLDRNNDGKINEEDEEGSTGRIVGVAIPTVIQNTRIRAARIWLLGRSVRADNNFTDTKTYVVGRQVIKTNDKFRKRLFESIVKCRNMGLS